MLNRIIIMGRLGKAPELRHTQQGMPVVSFSLAGMKRAVPPWGGAAQP